MYLENTLLNFLKKKKNAQNAIKLHAKGQQLNCK